MGLFYQVSFRSSFTIIASFAEVSLPAGSTFLKDVIGVKDIPEDESKVDGLILLSISPGHAKSGVPVELAITPVDNSINTQ